MRALFDVNMLLALSDARHPLHERARRWRLEHLGDGGWASCPLTQNGFVRIITQHSYPQRLAMPDALAILRQVTARADHAFWPDDVSLVDTAAIDHQRLLGPRQITGVYLLVLAVKRGGRLVTLDTGISYLAARGATAENLVVV
ncbi:MAG: hypothetical protein RL291_421 [Pseudomonadota bacterium]